MGVPYPQNAGKSLPGAKKGIIYGIFTLVSALEKPSLITDLRMDEQNFDVKLALEEMRINMQSSISDGNTIDQKMNMILVASGLVMALAPTMQITLSPTRSDLYWGVLIFTVVLYVLDVVVLILGFSPQRYHLAIASEWNQLNEHIFGRSERDAILTLLSGYVDQIQFNRSKNYRKVRIFHFSFVVLVIIVILLVILAGIP